MFAEIVEDVVEYENAEKYVYSGNSFEGGALF